jgi:AraC-like DNA-binding protein
MQIDPVTDSLADLLRMMKLAGSVYFQEPFASPWGIDLKTSPRAQFHLIAAGQCWFDAPWADQPVSMTTGDLVVFPGGARHALSDWPGRKGVDSKAVRDAVHQRRNPFVGPGASTTLICGHFELDAAVRSTFLPLLPTFMLMRASEKTTGSWMNTVIKIIIRETGHADSGGSFAAERLAEALLVEIFRFQAGRKAAPGLLAGFGDELTRRALDKLHTRPERQWSDVTIAAAIDAPPAELATRFRQVVRIDAMEYLNRLRLTRASQLLDTGDLDVTAVSRKVGFESDEAFIRAFKKQFGHTPASGRRHR